MLKKHRHQFEGLKKGHPEHGMSSSKVPLIRSLADIGKTHSANKSKSTKSDSSGKEPFWFIGNSHRNVCIV